MTSYRFAPVPSNSSVAAIVTFVACAWFLVASGAILTDRQNGFVDAARSQVVEEHVVPDDRVTVVVEARRTENTL